MVWGLVSRSQTWGRIEAQERRHGSGGINRYGAQGWWWWWVACVGVESVCARARSWVGIFTRAIVSAASVACAHRIVANVPTPTSRWDLVTRS